MKDHVEISVKTTHIGSELIADALAEYTEGGVFIADVQDVIDLEQSGKSWDYADDGIYSADKTVTVKCYVKISEKESAIKKIKAALISLRENSPFDLGELSVTETAVDGELWREKWKENFKPIHIGDVVIVPKWMEYAAAQDEKVVLLDSNMAFGTGEHETTSMCVEFLREFEQAGDVLIDVGTGSGILGIAASKLGAGKVIMTDIDECAVTAAKHNLELNGVSNAEVYLKNLLDDNTVKGDVIVANIMAEVLIAFAGGLKNNLNAGGTVILSGILIDRLDAVKNAYLAQGFEFIKQSIKGEWAAVVFKDGAK